MHSDQSKSDIQVGKSIKEHKQNLTSTSDMTKIVI